MVGFDNSSTQDLERQKFINVNGQPTIPVSNPDGTNIGGGGSATDGETAPTDPTLVAGVYNATPPTYTDGDAANLQSDVNGNLKTTEATLHAGEDLTNDVQKVEQRCSYSRLTADGAVKSGSGSLHSLTFACVDAAPTAGSIIVYDNTAESGTVIYSETFDTTAFRGYTVTLDVSFSTGLYIGFTTTADVGVTVSYR